MSRIAVLALQGAFAEHEAMISRLGAECFELRQKKDLDRPIDGFILPGGESTVMSRLLKELGLFDPLLDRIAHGLPVLGTCAGLFLLARQIEGGTPCFGTMAITARRNAYGRQLGSFTTQGEMAGLGPVPMTFIRAPYIVTAGDGVEILASVQGRAVAARQGKQLVTAFHPELTECTAIHRLFLHMITA